MKPILFIASLLLFAPLSQVWSSIPPIHIDSTKIVVAINAKTSDAELLKIRKDILRYSSVRFTNFDVIRGKNGDIYFFSMEVDCRDGYQGSISHSFEQGDESTWGFYRRYKKTTFQKPFFMGDLSSQINSLVPMGSTTEDAL